MRGLLTALRVKVVQCRAPLPSEAMAKALYVLQSLGDSAEVRALLWALTSKVQDPPPRAARPWNAQEVAQALRGLRRRGSSPELRGLLAALRPHAEQCLGTLSEEVGSRLLAELQPLGEEAEGRALLEAVLRKTDGGERHREAAGLPPRANPFRAAPGDERQSPRAEPTRLVEVQSPRSTPRAAEPAQAAASAGFEAELGDELGAAIAELLDSGSDLGVEERPAEPEASQPKKRAAPRPKPVPMAPKVAPRDGAPKRPRQDGQ